MSDNQAIDNEIEIHLKEYESLRGEIKEYIQRIDKYVGIYIAALFAIIAFLLNPASQINIKTYLMPS